MYAPTQPYQPGRSAGGMRAPYPNPQQMAYPVAGHPQAMYAAHPQQQHYQQPRYPQQMGQGYPTAQQQALYQQQHHGYPQQQQQAPHSSRSQKQHKGTLAPGQMIKVGKHKVRIEKYLSEGGYAHVYLTTSEQPIYPPNKSSSKGFTEHCLKRVAFQDENVWKDVRKEIEVMVRGDVRVCADNRKCYPHLPILCSIWIPLGNGYRTGHMKCSSSWNAAREEVSSTS